VTETMWDESYPPSLFGPPEPPPVVPITGVTAGAPGAFIPANAPLPANLAALKADAAVGDAGTNKPAAVAWTVGQHVVLGDATHAYWDAAAWITGDAPVVFVEEELSTSERPSKRKEKRAHDES
jgi:hypothetical protein